MRWLVAVLASSVLVACGAGGAGGVDVDPTAAASLNATSDAFEDGGTIPERFTCDGADQVPPLSWSDVPPATERVVVTMSDPDAPGGTFVHWWAVFPSGTQEVTDGTGAVAVGSNDFGSADYRGPCPPEGDEPHRYVVQVHAVNVPLDLDPVFSADDLGTAIEGHVLATGRLTARYRR